jgi:chemotaxis protein CheX
MKAKYINPFLSASVNLFQDYLGLSLKPETPYVRKDPYDLDAVSAIIGLAGETAGAVVLSFSRETAIKVVSILADKTYPALTNEVLDGVGELVNIIAGRELVPEFMRANRTIPGSIFSTGTRSTVIYFLTGTTRR